MKKYLVLLLGGLVSISVLSGNVFSFDLKENSKKYSGLISKEIGNKKDNVSIFKETHFNKNYVTKQYLPYENEMDQDYGMEKAIPEKKTTKGYNEVTLTIPTGYKVSEYMFVNDRGEILFPSSKCITLKINGKEVKFELDYDITSKDSDIQEISDFERDENGFTIISQPVTIKIRYATKYFAFKQYENLYHGMEIPNILEVSDIMGKPSYFVLEPDYKKIYNDFKFVREVK